MSKNAYAQSGVDVEAGYEVVERIKKHVARTERAGVMGGLGGFGGMFDLSKTGVKEPVLNQLNWNKSLLVWLRVVCNLVWPSLVVRLLRCLVCMAKTTMTWLVSQ